MFSAFLCNFKLCIFFIAEFRLNFMTEFPAYSVNYNFVMLPLVQHVFGRGRHSVFGVFVRFKLVKFCHTWILADFNTFAD